MTVKHSFRQVHLDFHTSPHIPDVGSEFDAAAFARTMKAAHVQSVNVFAKCHHGHLYYNTARPERHPGLRPELDLLGEQIEALHREGILAPIYVSVQCDEYAANTHPEWVARGEDGRAVGAGPLSPGWQILDMASPYQDYLAEQVAEILERFQPVDGLFFDMCWDQPSLSRFAKARMATWGYDPESPTDRAAYARRLSESYMRRFAAMVRASSPDALLYFNGRDCIAQTEEADCFEQFELESLPTGGWGYLYFPKTVRFTRGFGKPTIGMTARFHRGWADFGGLKPYAALEYETSQMVAHGARCSIGDQMHPRGVLDAGAYDLIGRAYARIAAREPWLEGAVPVAQIGVIHGTLDPTGRPSTVDEGVTRMFTQLKYQFDFIPRDRDLSRYELIVLPDDIAVDAAFAARLKVYLAAGGRIMASGTSGLTADGTGVTLDALGVVPAGPSPFTATYFRADAPVAADLPPSDHVMYERGVRVTPVAGAEALAGVVEPYFERSWRRFCSHRQTPGDKLSLYAAAVINGRAAYVAYPIFTAFAQHGSVPMKLLVRNILRLLLPRLLVDVAAPSGTEVTVTRQPGRTIVHLLHYTPERRGTMDLIEDIVPLHNVALALRMDRAPAAVYTAPERTALPCAWADGYARVRVPVVHGHAMVVWDDAANRGR